MRFDDFGIAAFNIPQAEFAPARYTPRVVRAKISVSYG